MKIWEKVNNITGNDSKSRYLVPFINAGSKFLLSALPEKFLWTIASETEVNGWDADDTNNYQSLGEGSAIAYDKILAVYRYDGATTTTENSVDYYRGKKRIAVEAPDNNIHIFDEDSSLLRATEMFPKFYKLGGKIFIKPDPDYNATASDKTYTPLGGSSTTLSSKAGDKGVIVYSAPPIIDENSDSWILTEYENIVIFYAASLDHFRLAATYRDLCKAQVDNVASGVLTLDISSVLPTSINLTKSLPTFSFSGNLPSDMVITKTLPSSFNIESSLPKLDVIVSSLPSDFNINTSLPSDFAVQPNTLSDFDSIDKVTKPTPLEFNLDATSISDALSKAEALVDGNVTTNNAQELLNDEDAEMVNALINVSGSEIQRAGMSINKEKNKLDEFTAKFGQKMSTYQNDINKYSAEVGEEVNKLKSQLEKHNGLINKEDIRIKSDLAKFNAEVQKESGRISSALAKYEREVSKMSAKFQAESGAYQAEIAKESARANIDVSVYNAELSKERSRLETGIAKYQADLSLSVQTFTLDLQAFQAEVAKEGQRISSDISKYELELNRASKKMEKDIQQFTLDMQAAQAYTQKSTQSIQTSGMYYQRAVNELGAITGSVAAPEQQQSSQRREQGATS